MKVKDIIRKSRMNWQKVENSNPSFKTQGQTKFTWKNYKKLEEEAKRFDNQNIELNDALNVKINLGVRKNEI